jgi:hypothetical protein
MLFILQCLDRAGSRTLRSRARVPHLEFVAAHTDAFRFGGPLIGDDGSVLGSLMILELPDRAALDRHMAADPFFSAGLFYVVNVWQSQQVVPEASPGALARELATARSRAVEPLRLTSGPMPLLRPTGDLAP